MDTLLIGHIAADVVPQGLTLGGTVGYAAWTAHAFGRRVGVLTSARPDDPLLATFAPQISIRVIPAAATTTYDNQYTPSGRVQYIQAVAEHLRAEHIPADWRTPSTVHLAPIADEISPDVITAFSTQTTMLITPQGFMRQWGPDGRIQFKRWFDRDLLKRAQFVVLSEEDIAQAPDVEQEYRQHTEILVVTQGDQGGRYYIQGEPFYYQAHPTPTVDPTGAGDVFAAALVMAWHHTADVHRSIRVAARLSAHAITRHGVRMTTPTPDEVQTALAKESD